METKETTMNTKMHAATSYLHFRASIVTVFNQGEKYEGKKINKSPKCENRKIIHGELEGHNKYLP